MRMLLKIIGHNLHSWLDQKACDRALDMRERERTKRRIRTYFELKKQGKAVQI